MSEAPTARREALESRLRAALQALALPAARQQLLYPKYAVACDELANDFSDFYRVARTSAFWDEAPSESTAALSRIDDLFDAASDQQEESFWTSEALATDPRWDEIRRLSESALRALSWPVSDPPDFSGEFVRGS
ncbi:unnamed protein product [Discosporangium mesarthrocarpum]